ncbi:FkbM family methyltransferase [Streptomyces sp. NPDC001307]|uniref:FkbM family methyltransferase n=1 Tax=Streptomyces sp. NPDC001307 TaxID=3364560 RepID=UPI003681A2FE
MIDVGANAGQYASDLRRFGYRGEIISFEPLSEAYRELAHRAAGDPHWHTQHMALGCEAGSAIINISANSVSSSLRPMTDRCERAAPESKYEGTQLVKVERLDEALAGFPSHTGGTLLKIDTQGFEREVLLGAPELMKQVTGVQLELSLTSLYSGQMLVDEAMRMMMDHGLRLTSIEPGFGDSETGEMLQFDGFFFRDTEADPA